MDHCLLGCLLGKPDQRGLVKPNLRQTRRAVDLSEFSMTTNFDKTKEFWGQKWFFVFTLPVKSIKNCSKTQSYEDTRTFLWEILK